MDRTYDSRHFPGPPRAVYAPLDAYSAFPAHFPHYSLAPTPTCDNRHKHRATAADACSCAYAYPHAHPAAFWPPTQAFWHPAQLQASNPRSSTSGGLQELAEAAHARRTKHEKRHSHEHARKNGSDEPEVEDRQSLVLPPTVVDAAALRVANDLLRHSTAATKPQHLIVPAASAHTDDSPKKTNAGCSDLDNKVGSFNTYPMHKEVASVSTSEPVAPKVGKQKWTALELQILEYIVGALINPEFIPRADAKEEVDLAGLSEKDRRKRENVKLALWEKASFHLPGRTPEQCQRKWTKLLENRRSGKRNCWTPDEAERLSKVVSRLGSNNWAEVATYLPTRNAKQCREKYENMQDTERKNVPWTAEEVQALMMAQQKFGNKWSLIAKLIPGRTRNDVKNFWYCQSRHVTGTDVANSVSDSEDNHSIVAREREEQFSNEVLAGQAEAKRRRID